MQLLKYILFIAAGVGCLFIALYLNYKGVKHWGWPLFAALFILSIFSAITLGKEEDDAC